MNIDIVCQIYLLFMLRCLAPCPALDDAKGAADTHCSNTAHCAQSHASGKAQGAAQCQLTSSQELNAAEVRLERICRVCTMLQHWQLSVIKMLWKQAVHELSHQRYLQIHESHSSARVEARQTSWSCKKSCVTWLSSTDTGCWRMANKTNRSPLQWAPGALWMLSAQESAQTAQNLPYWNAVECLRDIS